MVAGQRMFEAIGINKSLTVLGAVSAVGKGILHVPWRDAVLCQLLRTSLRVKGRAHGCCGQCVA